MNATNEIISAADFKKAIRNYESGEVSATVYHINSWNHGENTNWVGSVEAYGERCEISLGTAYAGCWHFSTEFCEGSRSLGLRACRHAMGKNYKTLAGALKAAAEHAAAHLKSIAEAR